MASSLVLTIRFLSPAFHGRKDGGAPEWPPSPLRLFQALVAAAAAQARARARDLDAAALRWLEQLPPPRIIAPATQLATGYRLSVPNNALDIVAQAWSRGNDSLQGDANPATHRAMKTVRPLQMLEDAEVHYLWPLPEGAAVPLASLDQVAQSVVVLGWGVDLALGQARVLEEDQVRALTGERWQPWEDVAGAGLRVPTQGSLDALQERHQAFLQRLGPEGFAPPPPLACFRLVTYLRAGASPRREGVAFALRNLDGDGYRAFDLARSGLKVAAMMRHATRRAAQGSGWSAPEIDTFLLGHGEARGQPHVPVSTPRMAYLPLPSLEGRGAGKALVVGKVRRVLLTASALGCERELGWAEQTLPGHELLEEGQAQPLALLCALPEADAVVRCYVESASTWATVTPVVLPGHDDPAGHRERLDSGVDVAQQRQLLAQLHRRMEGLLRKALRQAGYTQTLVEHADLEWSTQGFWPGIQPASAHRVPAYLRRYGRVHVRLTFRDERGEPVAVPGPVCLGGGRFVGLGLFAAVSGSPHALGA